MRWALVVGFLATACGTDHYGTYFIADGRNAKISFDHAEFYFGDHLGNAFGSPASTGPENGNVYKRLLNAADVSVPTDHAADVATYYLAADGDTDVGSYVLVIARDAQNGIVGVGEASAFSLAGNKEVFEIRAVLEAPGSNIQEWGVGTAPPCVSWTRKQGLPVAFVRPDDRDCDGALANADCNDFLYCGPNDPQCDTTPTLCEVPCALGCNTAHGCVASTCVFANACDVGEGCSMKPLPSDVLTCFAMQGSPVHLDVDLPTGPQNGHANIPCVYQFSVPLMGPKCANPTIVYTEPFSDGYTFEVEDGGTACKFQIRAQNQVPFTNDHHLLVAIDPPSGVGPRNTFFMGINPVPSAGMCTTSVSTRNPLMITSCP